MYLCIQWQDERLRSLADIDKNVTDRFPRVIITTKMDKFWKPILIFRNGLSTEVINSLENIEYGFIHLNNKTIRYCSKMENTYFCQYHFFHFPFDQQFCRFEFEDCKYNIYGRS